MQEAKVCSGLNVVVVTIKILPDEMKSSKIHLLLVLQSNMHV